MTSVPPSSNPPVRFGQPSSGSRSAPGFGRLGAIIGAILAAVVLAGLAWSAAAGRTVSAQQPRLIGGSLVLEDQRPLTVIDVGTGQVTVRLQGIYTDVAANSYGDVETVPVSVGTMLINRVSGTFNLLGKDNYVLDAAGQGVGLGPLPGSTGADGFAAGSMAYIQRYGPDSTVTLVDEATIEAGAKLEGAAVAKVPAAGAKVPADADANVPAAGANVPADAGAKVPAAAGPGRAVTPTGFATLGGQVAEQPGASAVSGSDLWTLVSTGPAATTCQVQQLHPVATGHNGLLPATRATLATPCRSTVVEAVSGAVGVVTPGHVRIFLTGGARTPPVDVKVPAIASDSQFLPVTGASGALWFLARGAGGWSMFAVTPAGHVSGPLALKDFGPSADPVVPVLSGGLLYTLDQAAPGQPTLWTIVPATGAMIPVEGATTYPARTSAEKATFRGAQVLVDGPRVVFNNPGSLLAVVVFTDGSRAPVIIDKSSAMEVSTIGPADLNAQPTPAAKSHSKGGTPASKPAAPAPAVSQSVTCANTTQKPYAPQITSVVPSSGSALVSWSYQLLDEQDCEPDSWAVAVRAISTSHQPAQPVQIIDGQNQLQFTGLRPATTYRAVVTAYINAQSTSSTPTTFTTAARGPDAPTAVHVTADGKGDWVVSWTPCTSATCYVPADTWNVVGTACGSAFVGQPPTMQVVGSQTSAIIDAATAGLLGDSLTFSVQGALNSGLTGNPTSGGSCIQAWRPPNPTDIHLTGAGRQIGQTITATLDVSTGSTPAVDAFGSHSTEFVYHVGGITDGPTTAQTVQVPGLPAGISYTPTVSVYPSGQPASVVTITGAPFSQDLSWPADLAVTVKSATANSGNPNQGTIVLAFPNAPAGPITAAASSIMCGSSSAGTYPGGLLVDGAVTISTTFDLIDFGGNCTLSVDLSDGAASNPYGVPSPALQTTFSIGTPPNYTGDFTDAFTPLCVLFCSQWQVMVTFQPAGQVPTAGGDWTVTASGPAVGLGPCLVSWPGADQTASSYPLTGVPLDLPSECEVSLPTEISATVAYTYLGQRYSVSTGPPINVPGTTTTTTVATTTTTVATTTTTTIASTTSTTVSSSSITAGAAARRSATGGAPGSATGGVGGSGAGGPPAGGSAAGGSAAGASGPAGSTAIANRSISASSPASALLAVAAAPSMAASTPILRGDPEVRDALEWIFLAVGVAWCGSRFRPRRRRSMPRHHREQRKFS